MLTIIRLIKSYKINVCAVKVKVIKLKNLYYVDS